MLSHVVVMRRCCHMWKAERSAQTKQHIVWMSHTLRASALHIRRWMASGVVLRLSEDLTWRVDG